MNERNAPSNQKAGLESSSAEAVTQASSLQQEVARRRRRKLRARKAGSRSAWFGLGTFGMVGWSVALPTVLGVAAGTWIDRHWPTRVSWTLTLLLAGTAIGFANAWYWMNKQSNEE